MAYDMSTFIYVESIPRNSYNVVDPDPVGSASFFRIRIGIQGLPIRIRIRFY
jgi:hypothetical protein